MLVILLIQHVLLIWLLALSPYGTSHGIVYPFGIFCFYQIFKDNKVIEIYLKITSEKKVFLLAQ